MENIKIRAFDFIIYLFLAPLFVLSFYVYFGFEQIGETLKVGIRVFFAIFVFVYILLKGKIIFPSPIRFGLGLYLLLAVMSALYAADPAYSLMRSIDLVFLVLLAQVVSSYSYSYRAGLFLIGWVLFIYLIGIFPLSTFLGSSVFRPMGELGAGRLGGFMVNPNLYAYVAIFLIYIVAYGRRRSFSIFFGVSVAVLLLATILSGSRSAIGAMIFIYIFSARLSMIKLILITSGFLSFSYFAITKITLVVDVIGRGYGLENFLSIGGRTQFWGIMISSNFEDIGQILLGNGYQNLSSESRFFMPSNSDINLVSMAHNNVIETFMGLGVLGLLAFFLFWFQVFKLTTRSVSENWENSSVRLLFIRVSSVIFIFGMFEFGIFGPPNILVPAFFSFLFLNLKFNFKKSATSIEETKFEKILITNPKA